MTHNLWKVDIEFDESEGHTHADILLEAGEIRYRARGHARRNPIDPQRRSVGEELAAARALEDLAAQLREAAAHEIDRFQERVRIEA